MRVNGLKKKAGVAMIAAALSGPGMALLAPAAPAGAAGSVVQFGGYATCAWYGSKTLPAQSVNISLDSGGSVTVGTSANPFSSGLYRASLPNMPRGGTGATVTVTCSSFSLHPGAHRYRTWYQPAWNNTTGDRSFWGV